MRTYLIIRRAVFVLSLMLIASFPALSAQAADQSSGGAIILAPLGVVAPSAIEDTLKACLARIPKDASAGQRMLAERSCQQDEGTRKMVQAAPKF
jgi:hypothetical protein